MDLPAPAKPLRLEWVDPSTLDDHPKNWRLHPPLQREAVGAVLDEVGWAGAILWNERSGRIIDGHLRKKLALEKGIACVPVLVGDWDEATEAKILVTLDPLASLADTDPAMLDSLLRDVETGSSALATLLTQLAEEARLIPPEESSAASAGGEDESPAPEGGPDAGGDKKVYLLEVSCPTEAKRTDLMASLRADGYDCSAR
jgi:hypothetical protein